eukprot:403364333
MNNTQKRDIQYNFISALQRPILSQIIDDDWRREKFTDLDIILSTKTVQAKLNMDSGDEEAQQRVPITEVREWNDLGFNELIASHTESSTQQHAAHMGFR